jgi:hypothetical protein
MGLKEQIKRLRRALEDNLESFELADGTTFFYGPQSPELFMYTVECGKAQAEGKPTFPEPPAIITAIARARDRAGAFYQVFDHDRAGAFVSKGFPFEYEALIEEGNLMPRSLIVGAELGEPLPDLFED